MLIEARNVARVDVGVFSVPSQAVYGDTGDPRHLQDQQLLLQEQAVSGALDFSFS